MTLSGMVMLVRLVQPQKASGPMLEPLVITTVFKLVFGIEEMARAGIVAV